MNSNVRQTLLPKATDLRLALITMSILLTACGQSSQSTANGTETPTLVPASQAAETSANMLPSSPISVEAIVNDTPPSFSEPGPCPFLSDETAIAAVSTPYEITRKRVSNGECVWNYNIGFEINVSIKPVADATPRARRTYNMDVPPVIGPQDGPGMDAVLFSDPTWNEASPRPYAFAFSLGDREVMITTVGTKTSLAQLRSAADEIAAKLPSAVLIEPQQREEVPAFNACNGWAREDMLGVFGLGDDTVGDGRPSASSTCLYEFFPASGGSVKAHISFFKCDESYADRWKNDGYTQLKGFASPALVRVKDESWGQDINMYAVTLPACIQIYSPQNRAPVSPSIQAGMEALLKNAMSRIVVE